MKTMTFSRSEKRLILFSSLAVLAVAGLGYTQFSGKNGQIPPRAPLPTPNGFDLYLAAAGALKQPNPPVDETTDRTKRTPQEAARLYTPARRAAFVAQNAKTWDLMRQARAAQSQHPGMRGTVPPPTVWSPLRELARAKTIEAKHFLDLKRPDLALQSGLDTMEMGRDIEQGAVMIGSLVGIAVEAVGAAGIEKVPPLLDAKSAKNGARRLERIIKNGALPSAILTEEKWAILTSAKQGKGPILYLQRRPLVPMMDAFIAQGDKPRATQSVPPLPGGLFDATAGIIHPVIDSYGFNVARRETSESALLLRLALRAYHVEKGSYPATLSQLAPQYLAKIPRDAFGSGETLRYGRKGDVFRAWSIGPDGKDDGGAPIPLEKGKKSVVIQRDSVGDAVFGP